MNVLLIDTGGSHLTTAVLKGEKEYILHQADAKLKHSNTLMPEIEKVLEKSGLSLSDIDVFSAIIGPGSFTGIRIGVSTAKAFSYATNKKVLPVTSFEALAYNNQGGKTLAVINARHGYYYACGFENDKVVIEPCYIPLADIEVLAKDYEVVSDYALPFNYIPADFVSGYISAVKDKLSLATLDRETLIPLYVKKSQAEEECK